MSKESQPEIQNEIRDVLSRYGLYVVTDHWEDKHMVTDFVPVSQTDVLDAASHEIWDHIKELLIDKIDGQD